EPGAHRPPRRCRRDLAAGPDERGDRGLPPGQFFAQGRPGGEVEQVHQLGTVAPAGRTGKQRLCLPAADTAGSRGNHRAGKSGERTHSVTRPPTAPGGPAPAGTRRPGPARRDGWPAGAGPAWRRSVPHRPAYRAPAPSAPRPARPPPAASPPPPGRGAAYG